MLYQKMSNIVYDPGFNFDRSVRVNGMTKRAGGRRLYKTRNRVVIPRVMSKRNKSNLRKNLVMLGEKFWVYRTFNASQSSTPTINPLTDIGQGTTDQQREGDQLTIRSIEVNWSWNGSSLTTPDQSNIGRIIVFQWFPATVPSAANILADLTPAYVTLSPYNHDSRFQFKILLDKKSPISLNGPSVTYNRRYIKGGMKRKIQYIAGSSVVAANMIYVLMVSDSGVIPDPIGTYAIKVNYSDY